MATRSRAAAAQPDRYAFATVGTTRFDAMVGALLHPDATAALRALGLTRLVVQLGRSDLPPALAGAVGGATALDAPGACATAALDGLRVTAYRMKASIAEDLAGASLVVSHAGAGSIFEGLRAGRPLLVVTNPALADNHQVELAGAMAALGHLAHTEPGGLAAALRSHGPGLLRGGRAGGAGGGGASSSGAGAPLPPPDGARFVAALDAVMGFPAGGAPRTG